MITKRGKPDDGDLVHLRVFEEWREDHPACYNGNFHIFWSTDVEEVTCPSCRSRIDLGVRSNV